jgi:hypothetical protein
MRSLRKSCSTCGLVRRWPRARHDPHRRQSRFLIRRFEDGYVKRCAAGEASSRSITFPPSGLNVRGATTPDRLRPESPAVCPFRIRILRRCLGKCRGLPATDQLRAAVDQGPMTSERPWSAPPRSPWPENAWQVVIGRPGSLPPGRHAQRPKKPESCEALEHRSPPFSALRGGPVSETRSAMCDHQPSRDERRRDQS